MASTTIFNAMEDNYDGIGCIRIEGAGEIPGSPLQVEQFANDEWTAWYTVPMATCQDAYDWRETTAAISGTDLHELFTQLVNEPSPAGATRLPMGRLTSLARRGNQDAKVMVAGLLAGRETWVSPWSE